MENNPSRKECPGDCEESDLRVLVTGATGFAGGYLTRALVKEGHNVSILARASSHSDPFKDVHLDNILIGDISDLDSVEKAVKNVDIVYHLAANFRQAGVKDDIYRKINVEGTKNVLHAALKKDVQRVVHCSTIGVHGHVTHVPANEQAPFNPGDIYQETKLEAERFALNFHKETGLPVAVIRPTSIYGSGDLRMLKLFRMIQKGTFIMLGNGRTFCHPVYVEDLVEGFKLCGTHKKAIGEVFIIGGNEYITLSQLVTLIADELRVKTPRLRLPVFPFYVLGYLCEKVCVPLGVEPPIYRRRVAFFLNDRAFDISKAKSVLGYNPKIDLKTGIRLTAEWYIKHGYLNG
jgi:dihydroflavonol-4-reductase